MANFIKRIFNIKALAPLVFFSSTLSVPAMADGVTTPTKFLVTFYRIGFLNTSDGIYFDLFNNPGGVQIDISKTGSTTALVSNAPAPPLGKTYNVFYAITKNIYTLNGSSQGCYTKAISVNADANTSWITTNIGDAGDLVLTNNLYSPNNYGPNPTSIDGTVTGATTVTSMYQLLVKRANPFVFQNGNLAGTSNADVELYYGILSNSINPSSYPNKTFSLGFNVTNTMTLVCTGNPPSMSTQVKYSMTLN